MEKKNNNKNFIGSLQSPAVAEVHPVPMGRWDEQMLLVDWLVEGLAAGLWGVGCHSGPGTVREYHVGTAQTMDLLGEERTGEET